MYKPNRYFLVFSFLIVSLISLNLSGQTTSQIEHFTKNREDRVSWWNDARYGMFIHWGVYAQLAGEWKGIRIDGPGEWIMYNAKIPVNEYHEVAKQFNPVEFDAYEWVKIAKDAGMKYIVITAKHCDGFAMYDSDVSDYNIVDYSQFSRDPILELRKACDEQGLKLGFYYSHNWDWHEQNALGLDNTWDFPDRENKKPEIYYKEKSIPQIKELVEKYAPEIMWFDVPTDIDKETSFEILKLIREIKPECIINDRISHEHQERQLVMGDFYTPEQYVPANLDMDFETCMTLNDTWGYKFYDHNWKNPKTVIENLVKNASMGGNYLLNVGPDEKGKIPANSAMILKTAGKWLAENGESIYGSSASPLNHVFYDNAVCTAKPGKLFIHLFQWPEKDELLLGEINAEIKKIYLLQDENLKPFSFQQNENNDVLIKLTPKDIESQALNSTVNTLVIEYSGELNPQNLPVIVDPFNTASFKPKTAEINGNAAYAFNNRWDGNRGYEMKEWNSGGSLQWNFRTIRDGIYEVELVYGANELSGDSQIHVNINGESFLHKITEGNGWYTPKNVKLGRIEIKENQSCAAKLTAGHSLTHTVANFMELRLVPAGTN